MNKVDFHCHSTASDGELSPQDLANRADEAGLTHWALTDHDTLDGYHSLVSDGYQGGLVPGIEISTQFGAYSIHIVGLGFDPNNTELNVQLKNQMVRRIERAQNIAKNLEKIGLNGVSEFVTGLGQRPVSRPEIARYLVETGQVKDMKRAFNKYLGKGKAGDVKQVWPNMHEALRWIKAAGGVSVFAHPDCYSITRTKLRAIIKEFASAGGDAIELPHEPATGSFYKTITGFCEEFGLAVSVGSDFHSDKQSWRKLGQVPDVSHSLTPVWRVFS